MVRGMVLRVSILMDYRLAELLEDSPCTIDPLNPKPTGHRQE